MMRQLWKEMKAFSLVRVSRKTGWMGDRVCLEQPGAAGWEGWRGWWWRKGAKDRQQRRADTRIKQCSHTAKKNKSEGSKPRSGIGHIFTGLVMCHLGERFWCYFYSLQNMLLLTSLLHIWKYSAVLDPGPSHLVAVLKALGNALVPCVVPPPYLHWGFALSWAILSPPQFELIWSSNPFLLGHKARMQPPMQSGVATTEF